MPTNIVDDLHNTHHKKIKITHEPFVAHMCHLQGRARTDTLILSAFRASYTEFLYLGQSKLFGVFTTYFPPLLEYYSQNDPLVFSLALF